MAEFLNDVAERFAAHDRSECPLQVAATFYFATAAKVRNWQILLIYSVTVLPLYGDSVFRVIWHGGRIDDGTAGCAGAAVLRFLP